MTDRHLHVLAMVARHTQRRLEEHDANDETTYAGSAKRRRVLKTRAVQTRARVAAAQARRRRVPQD